MITKFFSRWSRSESSVTETLEDIGDDKFKAFYTSLATQIGELENLLGQESHFSLAWILSSMDFVRSLHSSVYNLIEEVWLPMRKTLGMDVVETYFGVNVNLLEICNYLRDGVSELEYYQLSLEHCLGTLGRLVGSLGRSGDSGGPAAAEKQLGSCRLELEKMESKTAPNLWLEMKCTRSRGTGGKKKGETELSILERSVSVLPSTSVSNKVFLIAQVMRDVRVVITFISSLVLWVLTDTSEQFSFSSHGLDGPRFSPGTEDGWSAALSSLRDRIENSELKQKKSNCALSLKEIRAVYDAVRDLMEQLEGEMQQKVKSVDMDQSELLRAALDQSRGKLYDMTQISERLGVVTQDLSSEILHSQGKLMKIVENQFLRSITI